MNDNNNQFELANKLIIIIINNKISLFTNSNDV